MFVLTVIIRFSAQGAYILLVNQERSLIQTRALISFWETVDVQKKALMFILKRKGDLKTDFLSLDPRTKTTTQAPIITNFCDEIIRFNEHNKTEKTVPQLGPQIVLFNVTLP